MRVVSMILICRIVPVVALRTIDRFVSIDWFVLNNRIIRIVTTSGTVSGMALATGAVLQYPLKNPRLAPDRSPVSAGGSCGGELRNDLPTATDPATHLQFDGARYSIGGRAGVGGASRRGGIGVVRGSECSGVGVRGAPGITLSVAQSPLGQGTTVVGASGGQS